MSLQQVEEVCQYLTSQFAAYKIASGTPLVRLSYDVADDLGIMINVGVLTKESCPKCTEAQRVYRYNSISIDRNIIRVHHESKRHYCSPYIHLDFADFDESRYPLFTVNTNWATRLVLRLLFPFTEAVELLESDVHPFGGFYLSRGWTFCTKRESLIPSSGRVAMKEGRLLLMMIARRRGIPRDVTFIIGSFIKMSYKESKEAWRYMESSTEGSPDSSTECFKIKPN